MGFLGALRTLLPVAQPHERAGLMAAFYIMSYLAFCIPAILAGITTSIAGLTIAVGYYGGTLILLAAMALIGMRKADGRSEARRVGEEGVSKCRYRWSPYT